MAELTLPIGTHITTYTTSTGNSTGASTFSAEVVVTDGDGSDNEFSTSDSLTATVNGNPFGAATYVGKINIAGTDYPIVGLQNGVTYVFGIQLDTMTYPTIASLGANTSNIVVCFAKGTLIATPVGETCVETLKTGDEILNSAGDSVRVQWIGRQTVSTRFSPAERLRPVRFAAGSLGNGLPHSDLTVTADHAMLVKGVLCNASALVNGNSISRVPLAEMSARYTVYHIETEEHEIILANGAATETYIDHTSRRAFDNYTEYEALYGEEAEMEDLPLPRITTARQLPHHILAKINRPDAA